METKSEVQIKFEILKERIGCAAAYDIDAINNLSIEEAKTADIHQIEGITILHPH